MEPQALIGFLIVAVTLTCTPGPDWAVAIASGLGRRSFVPSVAGLCSGYVLHTILLAAGIAALMAAAPALLLWLTIAGAVYLLWLGIKTTRSWRGAGFNVPGSVTIGPNGELPAPSATAPGTASGLAGSSWGAYLQGFGTSAINPKGMLLFVALTPQFIRPEAAFSVPLQSVILGMSFVLSTIVIYTLVAAGARRLLRSRPGAARGVTLSSGIIMCALGAVLLVEQISPVTEAAGRMLAHG
ncbi:lysine exporter protein LysE/YggA family [Arthrobacter sp. PAMC 25486]|uniref:LysE family translocator n=1 Tax=Arthrobacter sp. PAMC 25486 TaxID=1494608 RepID=UPI000535D6DF|nr:LysE family translocator [Arthrobacter sp. PAMC 25486]AIY02253.1 lysine exporter protein LysE/YggA family [Arthrobacter sp. PAMC 25486]